MKFEIIKKISGLDIPNTPPIYGFKINKNNSNPATCVEYINDSVGINAGSNDWLNADIFKNIKPCMFKNGVVNYYLNPNDLNKKLDGTSADIITGNDGDVMVEVPTIYWNFTQDDNYVYVKLSTIKPSEEYVAYAHLRDNVIQKCVYRGCFEGFKLNNKIRSLASKSPTANINLNDCRTLCRANGKGYELDYFYLNMLWQSLFILFYKTTNAQSIFNGCCGKGSSNNTGTKLTGGANWGITSNIVENMSFLWIENWYGNVWSWMDGIGAENYSPLVCQNPSNFNTNLSTYIYSDNTTNMGNSYISHIKGQNKSGYLRALGNGSATTYFCDTIENLNSELCGCLFGGNYNSKTASGAFCMNLGQIPTALNGGRLAFIK